MKTTFLSALLLVAVAGTAPAKLPASPYALPGTCPPSGCPRVQSAVAAVQSAGVVARERVGGVLGVPQQHGYGVPAMSRPVYGTWTTPAEGWYVAPPTSVPQRMAAPTRTPVKRQPIRNALRRLFGDDE